MTLPAAMIFQRRYVPCRRHRTSNVYYHDVCNECIEEEKCSVFLFTTRWKKIGNQGKRYCNKYDFFSRRVMKPFFTVVYLILFS